MHGSRPADEDRLPWLEPYREGKKPGKPVPQQSSAETASIPHPHRPSVACRYQGRTPRSAFIT